MACFLIAVCLFLPARAQMNKRIYQADYDAKTVKFGYFVGIPFTHLNMKFNNYFMNSANNNYAVSSPTTIGLKLGGVANIQLNDFFDFRILPTVALYNRKIDIRYIDPASTPPFEERKESRESAWFELPLMVKYKSLRRGNVRMYVFGGVRYAIETNPIKRRNATQFNSKASDFSLEYGTGLEIFREYFKFAPELHFSHGLANLVNRSSAAGTTMEGIDRLTTHTVTLYFLFE
ncbi:type IX secretion/gliding motility protein PorT/SprT [Emticicia fluvialis]